MATAALVTDSMPVLRSMRPWRIAVATALVVLADWLFFRRPVGVSLALFMVAACAAVALTNRLDATRRERLTYSGILVLAVLPVLDDVNALSFAIAILGVACFALGTTGALRGGLVERVEAVAFYLASGPFLFFRDLPLLGSWANRRGAPTGIKAVKGWLVPLAFGALFVMLFAAANPLIDNWLAHFSLREILQQLDMQRLMFWLVMAIAVWMVVGVGNRFAVQRLRDALAALAQHPDMGPLPPADPVPQAARPASVLFDDRVILRSLVLFNLLFAAQTAMDLNYLWRGAALPDGMSYAAYAHRGAYPLIVTALLAAAFVIVAMRPGSTAERSPLMRALVFLWVGQNVMLVVSSILRLELYVSSYLLTYWRVAAFIWMSVVASGLVLIVVRIVTGRSNAWLVCANLAVLTATVYACAFVNFADLVASYNVARSGDSAIAGRPLDLTYIVGLGPQAIPALDRYFAAHPTAPYFIRQRDLLARMHQGSMNDWRAWTWRDARLARYLDAAKSAQP